MDCKEGNAHLIGQISDLLEQLDEKTYAEPLEVFDGSTLGQHVRHVLNFYQSVLAGVRTGLVDYAARDRDLRIEESPLFARTVFAEIEASIRLLDEARELQVRADFAPDEAAGRPVVNSSVGRELMFAFDHAVHHLALIRIGIKMARPDLCLQEELGVAPSTIKYQKGQQTGV